MKKTIILLIIMMFTLSCGKEEVKKQRDTFESETAKEAMALAETVRKAFVDGDKNRIKELSTDKGFGDITGGAKTYESVDLEFTSRWLEIDKQTIFLNVAWKSAWKTSGRTATDQGMAVFQIEGRPMKISGVLRANPFVQP